MYEFHVYWTDKMKIDFLQRVILVHSYLYYEKDNSVWTDKHYDEIARQLLGLQKNKSKDWIVQNTQYGYVFYNFDANTGFDLLDRLTLKDKQIVKRIGDWIINDITRIE